MLLLKLIDAFFYPVLLLVISKFKCLLHPDEMSWLSGLIWKLDALIFISFDAHVMVVYKLTSIIGRHGVFPMADILIIFFVNISTPIGQIERLCCTICIVD